MNDETQTHFPPQPGRPSLFDEPMVQFSISVPKSVFDELETRAKLRHISRAHLAREIIIRDVGYMEEHEPVHFPMSPA